MRPSLLRAPGAVTVSRRSAAEGCAAAQTRRAKRRPASRARLAVRACCARVVEQLRGRHARKNNDSSAAGAPAAAAPAPAPAPAGGRGGDWHHADRSSDVCVGFGRFPANFCFILSVNEPFSAQNFLRLRRAFIGICSLRSQNATLAPRSWESAQGHCRLPGSLAQHLKGST